MKDNKTASDRSSITLNIKDKLRGRVTVAGIGNPFRGDDGFGPKLIENLKACGVKAPLFDCGTAPENYIFPILSSSPDTVVLIDAADIKEKPGNIRVLALDEISKVSFSTHSPSPHLFVDLLKTGKPDINVFVISIQPKTTVLGNSLSDEIKSGLDILAGIFKELLA